MLEVLSRHAALGLGFGQSDWPWFPDFLSRHECRAPAASHVDFRVKNFHVKLVETRSEMRKVLALRRSVFHREFAGKRLSWRSDRDAFDDVADHLAIFEVTTGDAVGLYRMIEGGPGREYYSSSEFDLGELLRAPGKKIELSRACLRRDYRTGVTISLLWRGLVTYARAVGGELLFGMSSIPTMNVATIAGVHKFVERHGALDLSLGITGRAQFRIPGFDAHLAESIQAMHVGSSAEEVGIPPLFNSYIKAGAKVCSQPVIDRAFRCADWLTTLRLDQLRGSYERKFLRN